MSYENGGANLEQTKSPLLKPAKQNAINEPLATLSFAGPAVKKQRDWTVQAKTGIVENKT